MKRIGIKIERQRAYGRRLCEGIVRYARGRRTSRCWAWTTTTSSATSRSRRSPASTPTPRASVSPPPRNSTGSCPADAARGTTVQKTIAEFRLKEALRLVKAGKSSPAEIARHCGFASVEYFTNSFTARFGKPPMSFQAEAE